MPNLGQQLPQALIGSRGLVGRALAQSYAQQCIDAQVLWSQIDGGVIEPLHASLQGLAPGNLCVGRKFGRCAHFADYDSRMGQHGPELSCRLKAVAAVVARTAGNPDALCVRGYCQRQFCDRKACALHQPVRRQADGTSLLDLACGGGAE
ncbi:hypothetical protein SDC9_155609 [bioreactor metagenome]|uniref:Uncharacterized protein n=1 Tax=bioreactor metagenome TaxID=1076179 RepID=A0A645F286_9ZZZZ